MTNQENDKLQTDKPLRLEYMYARDLTANPENWRTHPKEQMQVLQTAIDDVGWAGALLYNERTKKLLDGHARLKLFAEAGGVVPVLVGSWDEVAERKILATLDPIGGMAETDKDLLATLLGELIGSTGLGTLLDTIIDTGLKSATVSITDLKFHPRNYKKHPDDQLQHIMRSITDHGFYRNIVIAKDNTILAGQGVIQAAAKMGIKKVPVIRLDLDPNEPRALKVLTSDNEIGKLGEVDDRALTELLKEIMTTGDLLGTGYDEQKLAGLLYVTRPESEIQTLNEAEEWVGMPSYDEGEQRIRLVISFLSMEDREKFAELVNLKVDIKGKVVRTWSTRWPWTDRKDLQSTRFETEVKE